MKKPPSTRLNERLALAFVLCCFVGNAQQAQNFSQCRDGRSSCGPAENFLDRTALVGNALASAPFNYIVHQEIKRGGINYSTGSFVAPNLIVTAHHNVYKPGFLRKLAFCNKSVDPDKWVRFKRSEVEIVRYGSVNAPTDIAVIRIKDSKKIAELYRGHFDIGEFPASGDTLKIHLTGFPCDRPDTLVEKSVSYLNVRVLSDNTVVGYQLYTCTGDSGAPLWYRRQGVPTMIGIHHGGGEGYFPDSWNCSARFTRDVINWIAEQKVKRSLDF